MRRGLAVLISSFILLSSAVPSRAGVRVGVYVGPGPWWGYGYPYYPYYDYGPPAYYYLYDSPHDTGPDNSHQDLKFLYQQIAHARNQAKFDYDDGDISRADYKAELSRLYRIKKEAQTEAKLNGGYLTGDQENEFLQLLRSGDDVSPSYAPRAPEVSNSESVKKVTHEITRLSALLDTKLKEGNITRAQYDSLKDYLNRTEEHVKSDAADNDGALTSDQESAVLLQLQRINDSLTKNLVVN